MRAAWSVATILCRHVQPLVWTEVAGLPPVPLTYGAPGGMLQGMCWAAGLLGSWAGWSEIPLVKLMKVLGPSPGK